MKEKTINKALNLPQDYKIGFDDAMNVISRFNDATSFTSDKITKISFIYYKDKYGDFLNKQKTHFDYIVKDMFNNLNSDDRFELLTYFSNEK